MYLAMKNARHADPSLVPVRSAKAVAAFKPVQSTLGIMILGPHCQASGEVC